MSKPQVRGGRSVGRLEGSARGEKAALAHSRPMFAVVALLLGLVCLFPGPAAAKVLPAEVEAYSDAFAVANPVAKAHLETQHRAPHIVENVRGALKDEFAGVWFDGDSGDFVVPLPPGSSRGVVAAALARAGLKDEYRFVTAPATWAEMEAAQDWVNAEVRRLVESGAIAAGMVATSLDAHGSAVLVRTALEMEAGEESRIASLAQRAGDVPVRFEKNAIKEFRGSRFSCGEGDCPAPLRGGMAIYNSSGTCSAGFRARGYNGQRYVLTAGHCIDGNQPRWLWEGRDPDTGEYYEVGVAEQWQNNSTGDWAKLNASGRGSDTPSWPSAVVVWGGVDEKGVPAPNYPVNEWRAIEGEALSYQGQALCHSGERTGTTCGVVSHMNVTVEWSEEETSHGLTEATGKELCAWEGDSGGSVFADNVALGLLVGGGWPPCYEPGWPLPWMVFSDITKATNALNVHIGPIASTTTLAVQNMECPPDSVRLSGAVTAGGGPLHTGTVNLQLSRWEGGQWVLKRTVPTALGNGSYDTYVGSLESGAWRAKAVLPVNEWVWPSESGFQEFTIAAQAGPEGNDSSPGPRPVARCNDEINVFYREPDGDLGNQWWSPGAGWVSGTVEASIAPTASPEPLVRPSGQINVFYRDANGDLGNYWWSPALGWKGETLDASMASDPEAVLRPNGDINVFYRESDGDLGNYWWSAGGGWVNGALEASMASGPEPLVRPDGDVSVFYRDVNGDLGSYRWNPTTGWVSKVLDAWMASEPRAVVRPAGDVNVFYREPDGDLGSYWWSPAGGWTKGILDASMASPPRPVVRPSGEINVFYRHVNGNLGNYWWSPSQGWRSEVRSASMASNPFAYVRSNEEIDVFYRDTGGKLGHHWWRPNGGWSTTVMSASMASAPRAVYRKAGDINVFYRDANGNLGNLWWSPSAGWANNARAATIAPRPPLVGALSASNVSGGSATLKATVNPESSPTTYRFQWNTKAEFEKGEYKVAPIPAGTLPAEAAPVEVSETLTGLKGETEYRFRVVAESPEGTTTGAVGSFTSLPRRPNVGLSRATDIGATGATLLALVNPRGLATTYRFEWGASTAYGNSVPVPDGSAGSGTSNVEVKAALSGLEAGKTYHFRVLATNSEGTTATEDRTFTTDAMGFAFGSNPVSLKGDQSEEWVLRSGLGPVYCTPLTFTGQAANRADKVIVSPGDAGCKFFGAASPLRMNGCQFELDPYAPQASGFSGAMGILCPEGKAITLDTPSCDVTFGAGSQAPATFKNLGTGNEAKVSIAPQQGLKNTVSGCGAAGTNYEGGFILEWSMGAKDAGGAAVSARVEPEPELAETRPASDLKADGKATLRGVLNPRGLPIEYAFEYGEGIEYGAKTPTQVAQPGSGAPIEVARAIEGLRPEVTYHYRLFAKDAEGSSYGEDKTFEIRLLRAKTRWATDLTPDGGATLRGRVSHRGLAFKYRFQYGPTSAYGSETKTTTVEPGAAANIDVAQAVVGLQPKAAYHYRLVVEDADGTAYGADRALEIGAPAVRAEEYPASVSGEQLASDKLVLGLEGGLSVSCAKASFTDALGGDSPSLALAPSFSECSGFGSLATTVSANGCTFLWAANGESWGPGFPARLDVECPAGKAILFDAGSCAVEVGPQAGLGTGVLSAQAGSSPKRVALASQVSGLQYTKTKDLSGCPLAATGPRSDGTLKGSLSLGAQSAAKEPLGLDVSGFELDPHAPRFEAEGYAAALSGEQVAGKAHTLSFEGGLSASCSQASFTGALSADAGAFTVAPTYSGCSAFGFSEATIALNGCTYSYSLSGEVWRANYPGSAAISCPEGKAITITAGACTVTIPAQSGLAMRFSTDTAAAPQRLLAQNRALALKYTKTKDGFLCPLNGTGAKEDGKLLGTASLKGQLPTGAAAGVRVAGSQQPAPHPPRFEAESYPAALSGSQDPAAKLTTTVEGGLKVSCENAGFSGTLAASSASLTATPAFSGCTAFGLAEATVNANGCSFAYALDPAGSGASYPATMQIACPEGKAIVIVAGTCEVSVPAQSGLAVAAANAESLQPAGGVAIAAAATKLKYTKLKDGFGCPLAGTGAKEDGALGGTARLQAQSTFFAEALGLRVGS